MNKLTERLAGLGRGIVRSVREYPLEAALGLVYLLIYVFRMDVSNFFAWFFPQFVLLFTLRKFKDRHPVLKYLYYLSWFLWIPLLLWCSKPDTWSVSISYLLAFIALVIGTEKMENVPFGRNVLSVGIRLGEGLLVGCVLWLVIYAVAASVDSLFFGGNLSYRWYSIPTLFNWLIVVPLLCCSLVDKAAESGKAGNLVRIIVDLVLSPALILYAVILYLYIVRIMVRWELPNGGVAYMVLAFLCVALMNYLLRLQFENRHFEWFYKAFPAIAVPPLVLLWIGAVRRVGEYGLTASRLYLLVLAALVTVFVAMLLKERSRRFQLMVMMLAASAILLTFIPGVRARDFGIRSQMSRLDELLPDVLVDGHFPVVDNAYLDAADSVLRKKLEISHGAWDYLKSEMDSTAFNNRYGAYGRYVYFPWTRMSGDGGPSESFVLEEALNQGPKVWTLSALDKDIDLGPYTQLVHGGYIVLEDSLGIAFRNMDNPADTLLYCPVREHLDKAGDPEDIHVYENGRYKGVIWIVRDYSGHPSYHLTNSMSVLFKKPEEK